MPRFVAIFDDKTDGTASIRQQHAEDHFAFLAAHADKIRLAGGLRPATDAPFEGVLWVLEVADAHEARALIEADPYFTLGLRKGYRLALWGKAPCYGDVVL